MYMYIIFELLDVFPVSMMILSLFIGDAPGPLFWVAAESTMESNVEQLQAARDDLKQITAAYLAQIDRMLAKDPFAHGRVRALSLTVADSTKLSTDWRLPWIARPWINIHNGKINKLTLLPYTDFRARQPGIVHRFAQMVP